MLLSSLRLLARCRFRFSSHRRASWNRPNGRDTLRLDALETRALLSIGPPGFAVPNYVVIPTSETATPLANSGPTGYQPSQLAQAYGFNLISYNGSGSTIAIVDAYDDPNIVNDLQTFNTQFSLRQLTASTSPGAGGVPTITVVNQTGGVTSQTGGTSSPPPTDPTGGWETEEALDVEWAHAMAPGANIVLAEANSTSLSDLLTAAQSAHTLGANVVSMSWGGSEFSGENSYDSSYFTTPGVVYVNASGDSGSPVGYPGASPDVVAVGGTTLDLDSQNNISSETGWSGSGGGISADEPQPSYQQGVVTQSTSRRTNPDVAYDANPATGVPVYDSYAE
jgi:subtilase family serine protease